MNETTETTTTISATPADTATVTAATTATEVQPADAGAQGAAQQQQPGFLNPMTTMMLLLLGLFYFMAIRPQQRKEKERRQMIDQLRSGARIVFAGGIIGTIVEASEKTFVVETKDGCKMEIFRSCVQGVLGADGAAEPEAAK